MGTGIIVCGLNGAGKSTLGKALADRMQFHFMDMEDLYFSMKGPYGHYASPRSHEEVEKLLYNGVKANGNFVLASVKGDRGNFITSYLHYAFWVEVPAEIRAQRVRNRSFRRFGGRMMPGGDLHEQEEAFFEFVRTRPENTVREWLHTLTCPVIEVDGTRSVEENIDFMIRRMRK